MNRTGRKHTNLNLENHIIWGLIHFFIVWNWGYKLPGAVAVTGKFPLCLKSKHIHYKKIKLAWGSSVCKYWNINCLNGLAEMLPWAMCLSTLLQGKASQINDNCQKSKAKKVYFPWCVRSWIYARRCQDMKENVLRGWRVPHQVFISCCNYFPIYISIWPCVRDGDKDRSIILWSKEEDRIAINIC